MEPEKYECISGSVLKVLAVVTMITDHIASLLIQDDTWMLDLPVKYIDAIYYVMRTVGRMAFPLFAFLLTEGFIFTGDRKKYGIRLFVFALLSEIPWDLSHSGTFFNLSNQNVFITLFLGYLGLCVIERLEEKKEIKDVFLLLGLLLASFLSRADFGSSGFGFILMLWLLRKLPLQRAVVGTCFLSGGWRSGLAFIPICLYNHKRGFIKGPVLKILFYAIYPLHLLILFLIKKALGGY